MDSTGLWEIPTETEVCVTKRLLFHYNIIGVCSRSIFLLQFESTVFQKTTLHKKFTTFINCWHIFRTFKKILFSKIRQTADNFKQFLIESCLVLSEMETGNPLENRQLPIIKNCSATLIFDTLDFIKTMVPSGEFWLRNCLINHQFKCKGHDFQIFLEI